MAKINDLTIRSEPGNVLILGSIAGLLCMIVAVVGIKFKWFKHRLTFDSIPRATSSSSASGSSSSTTPSSNGEPQIVRATFRTGDDFDNFIDYTPPKELPPIRINNHRPPVRPMRKPMPAPPIPTSDSSTIQETSIKVVSTVEQPLITKLKEPPTRPTTPPPPAFKYQTAVATTTDTTMAVQHTPMPLSPVIIFTDSPPTPRRIETPSLPPTPILLSPPIIKRHTPPPKCSPLASQIDLSISQPSTTPPPPLSPPLPIQINKESPLILHDQERELPIYAVIQPDRKSRNSHQENVIETLDSTTKASNVDPNNQQLSFAEPNSPMTIPPASLTEQKTPQRPLPSPPPYEFQELTQKHNEHFKKMFKKKSKSPGPTTPTNSNPKNDFLYQVPNAIDVPVLRHNSSSLENLTTISPTSNQTPPKTMRSLSAIDLDKASNQLQSSSLSSSPQRINSEERREKSKSSIFNFSILKSITSPSSSVKEFRSATPPPSQPQPPERINKEKKKKTKIIRVLKDPKPAKRQIDRDGDDDNLNIKNQSIERPTTLSLREQSNTTVELTMPPSQQPVPKQRTKLNLTPVSGKQKQIEQHPKPPQRNKNNEENLLNKKVQPPPENKQLIQLNNTGALFDITADDDSSWNLVAQHRKNTQAMEMAQTVAKNHRLHVENSNNNDSILEKNPALIGAGSKSLLEIEQQHQQQISLLNKPKTMREMRKDQLRNQELKAQENHGSNNDETIVRLTNGQQNTKKNDESDTDV